ncbi:MAG: DNA-3-methyladenine glycosylase 2 family protein [Methylicorpusculum sp.]|nr:DNA-3-methyladenine glycosylase 2 family protein [Methylicorpusculum sp.]
MSSIIKHHSLSACTIRAAEKHLSQSCEVMSRLIVVHGSCSIADREFLPFQTLATSIISQQLSAKAANTIEQRVLSIVSSFTPASFLSVPVDVLRGTGMSSAKARHIIELAQRVCDGRLNFDALLKQDDEDVITALVDLPGIGRWTAEMFLIFGLKRPDILALGDAGLKRAARLLYGEDATLESLGQAWMPYCSVASWYLWRHLDDNFAGEQLMKR